MKVGQICTIMLAVALLALHAGAADITIGTGTYTSSYPLATGVQDARSQVLYLATEIGAAKKLYSLALDVAAIPGQTMNQFTIRLKHTDLSAYDNNPAWESSGWMIVYQANQTITSTGWNTFTFTTPFVYNGTQNLMVDISFNNSSYSTNGICRRTQVSTSRSLLCGVNNYSNPALAWTGSTPTGSTDWGYLNIRLGYSMTTVPAIVGMEQTAAQAALALAELLSGNVSYVFSNTVAAGNVMSQSPAAGQSVFAGTPINYVVSAGVKYSGGGTASSPYLISNKWHILGMGTATSDYSKYFVLTADIDLEGQIFTDAIIKRIVITQPPREITFNGTFDGKDYCIKNFAITAPSNDYVGLFGYVNYGIIKNLGVENNGIQGRSYVGGLAGYNRGTITNCYTAGLVSSSNNTVVSTGLLQRTISCVGGLIGYTEGSSIMNCYSHCSVNASAVASSSSIEAWALSGGVIGESHGTLTNCYSTGSVASYAYSPVSYDSYSFIGGLAGIGDTVANCYSTGTVTVSGSGYVYKGGLVGSGSMGEITNSFWDTQTSGLTTSAGGTGKTTIEMKTLSTFTDSGWNFAEDWSICEGTSYPRLTWQIPDGDWVCPDGVNVEDFDYFVEQWFFDNCTSGNNYCGGADMDRSGAVNFTDFAALAGHWLEGI